MSQSGGNAEPMPEDGKLRREIDNEILELLEEHPMTRSYLATRLEVSGEYIYQRIAHLRELGRVDVIHDGFYQRTGWRDEHVDD